MKSTALFAVLVSLGASAAPQKCNRRPDHSSVSSAAPSSSASLAAVVAIGNRPDHGQGGQGGHNGTGHWGGQGPAHLHTQGAPMPSSSGAAHVTTGTYSQGHASAAPMSAEISASVVAGGEKDSVPTTSTHSTSAHSIETASASSSAIKEASKTSASIAQPSPSATGTAGGGSGSSGGGTGLAINSQSVNSFSGFVDGGLDWYTGWAITPLSGTGNVEWVPQVFSLSDVSTVAAASKTPAWSGVTTVLSFNEPDMSTSVGGTDIDPKTAAAQHQAWVKNLGGNYQIGAPAVARGSKQWMEDWVGYCAGNCKYDFVPFHFYGTNADDLISYAQDFHTTFNKPLWVTEWSCKDYSTGYTCTDTEVQTFMKTAIDWFKGDGAGIVERWAYFGAFPSMATTEGNPNGLENADGSINAMGKYYLSL